MRRSQIGTFDQDRLAELSLWLEFQNGPIAQEILRLHYRMTIFRRFMEVCKNAPTPVVESAAEFQRWVMNCYGHTQLAAIRRQADPGKDVQSMMRFLLELQLCLDDEDDLQDRTRDDVSVLRRNTKLAVARATTTIAHLIDPDRRSADALEAETFTFADIHECVDYLGGLFNFYEDQLLSTTTALETWILTPWEYAFEFPWIIDSAEG